MRQGFKVIDVDTHVTPAMEVLFRYADKELLDRKSDLDPYIRMTKPVAGRGHPETEYGVLRVNPKPYSRVAGFKEEQEVPSGAGAKGAFQPGGQADSGGGPA
jgi:hypothetical protein